ncbi:ABC transporter ATP-binding protein [Limibaculum sp. FT325]|uniref:ABC transporter ATP-binding protein n=1 Tax=Thermohalobaculum sediminis TaxID=2939436 RepID=UPI0020C094C4|nr:ABC transporter ATP-binding protein [Limibaculum sediminis]MCL5777240.1 ABC transporter ATP-binding protein [Limibaculum sediminis]
MTDRPPVLVLDGITKRFGPLVANDCIELTLAPGEIVALLGENGAGKTTLMNILFGHYTADAGRVRVADGAGGLSDLEPGSPGAALAAGIGMVHQHFTLAENLTGLENIVLGTEPVLRVWGGRAEARAKAARLMRESGLEVDLDARIDQLTVGERQRVEILKALYRDVRVLVLDEPTAVLTPQEAEGLFAVLRLLAAKGLAVVFISHKLGEVLAVSHRIAVLRAGRKVGELETAKADRRAIADLMVGREVAASRRSPLEPGAPVLELDGVDVAGKDARRSLHGASLLVRAREIVGIAGVSGNGQAALAALIAGLAAPDGGRMRLNGRPVARHDSRAFVEAGVARVPEDRHHDGVVGAMSVAENVAIEDIRAKGFQHWGFIDFAAIRSRAEAAIRDYDVRCPGPDAPARLLSGGNIQKLILARVLERDPRLILANQPTRGLDVGAQAEVHRRLLAARERGAGVVLISEDLDELFALSDRIVVIHAGRLAEAGPPEALDRGTVGLMMAGHGREDAA